MRADGGMERAQGSEQEGPLDPHSVGPFCRIGVPVNAESIRLEKSKTTSGVTSTVRGPRCGCRHVMGSGGPMARAAHRSHHRGAPQPVDADSGGAEGARVVL